MKLQYITELYDVYVRDNEPCLICIFIQSFVNRLSSSQKVDFGHDYAYMLNEMLVLPLCEFSPIVIFNKLFSLVNKYSPGFQLKNIPPIHLRYHFQVNLCALDTPSHEKSEHLKVLGMIMELTMRKNIDEDDILPNGEIGSILRDFKGISKGHCLLRGKGSGENMGPACASDDFLITLAITNDVINDQDSQIVKDIMELPRRLKKSDSISQLTLFGNEECELCNAACIKECRDELGRFEDELKKEITSPLHGKHINALLKVLGGSQIFKGSDSSLFLDHFIRNPICAYNRYLLKNKRSDSLYVPCLASLSAAMLYQYIGDRCISKILQDHHLH